MPRLPILEVWTGERTPAHPIFTHGDLCESRSCKEQCRFLRTMRFSLDFWTASSPIRSGASDIRLYIYIYIYTVHGTRYTVHGTRYTVHGTRYTVHRTPYTVHRTPYTVHRTPYTVHRTPYTVHRTPYTVHRTPYTVHRTPYTVHRTRLHDYMIHGTRYVLYTSQMTNTMLLVTNCSTSWQRRCNVRQFDTQLCSVHLASFYVVDPETPPMNN